MNLITIAKNLEKINKSLSLLIIKKKYSTSFNAVLNNIICSQVYNDWLEHDMEDTYLEKVLLSNSQKMYLKQKLKANNNDLGDTVDHIVNLVTNSNNFLELNHHDFIDIYLASCYLVDYVSSTLNKEPIHYIGFPPNPPRK